MSKQVEFGEIDFEAIEYRNEYRHTKAVFAGLTAQALSLLTFLPWLFQGNVWQALLVGADLGSFVFLIAALFIGYRSRVIITGQSLILKRPVLKDVEILFSEIGELQINSVVIREGYDGDTLATDLSEARRIWDLERIKSLKIRSRDGKKKIAIDQSLENFERFCDDLAERRRLAIDRYLGYGKGTSLRQPERYLEARETLKTQREEALLKARSSSEIQKIGATKSE
jgi:hypothetical protein